MQPARACYLPNGIYLVRVTTYFPYLMRCIFQAGLFMPLSLPYALGLIQLLASAVFRSVTVSKKSKSAFRLCGTGGI